MAERLGEIVHRVVGELQRLEFRVCALGGDESLGGVFRIPGDHGIGGHAGHLPANRKAIGFVYDRVHGVPPAGRIYPMWRCGNKAPTVKIDLPSGTP